LKANSLFGDHEAQRGHPGCHRPNDLRLLTGHIEASFNEGMHSFDQYLMQLVKANTSQWKQPGIMRSTGTEWRCRATDCTAMPGILKPDPNDRRWMDNGVFLNRKSQ